MKLHLRRQPCLFSVAPCPHLAKNFGKVWNARGCREKAHYEADLATLPNRTSGAFEKIES
jgi:hypothetical protein